MEIKALGIDLGKNWFQLHGVDKRGKAVFQKKVNREKLPLLIANLPRCMIGMEACAGAHFWARKFQEMGHEVKLIAPQFVKPYVKGNKHDQADAAAICEAMSRPHMRFVPIKSLAQQEILAIHRVRTRLVQAKTSLVNEIRGLLLEQGITISQGIIKFEQSLTDLLDPEIEELSPHFKEFLGELVKEFKFIKEKIERFEEHLQQLGKENTAVKRLMTIPGIGPIGASALVASIGDIRQFKNGREVSAWLGLVPKQHSTGGKPRLLGISKRGDMYLRTLLIHGARSVISWAMRRRNPVSSLEKWCLGLIERRGLNRATVALANKIGRMIWALLAKEEDYKMYAIA
ncbi:transposase (plasmid) [Candidatus Paracaedimonas acanthamoebae]|nr:transposase [Candidatus Paracaedimonas acanthamoebae]